jgi:hypothetical protein
MRSPLKVATVSRHPLDEVIEPEAAAFVLAATERLVDSLPTDAFLHDLLHARAQSLAEALELGLAAAVDRPGQGRRHT